jgi:hypothetical protein
LLLRARPAWRASYPDDNITLGCRKVILTVGAFDLQKYPRFFENWRWACGGTGSCHSGCIAMSSASRILMLQNPRTVINPAPVQAIGTLIPSYHSIWSSKVEQVQNKID